MCVARSPFAPVLVIRVQIVERPAAVANELCRHVTPETNYISRTTMDKRVQSHDSPQVG